MQSWSIIIFCYNEVKTIRQVIGETENVLNTISENGNEIIIVDDGSFDGSTEIIKELEYANPIIKAVYHQRNKGIGAALKSGYYFASKDNVCAIPADGQFDINELLKFQVVDQNSFISFYRNVNDVYSPYRDFLSWFNRFINKTFLGISLRDVNWVKIYKKSKMKDLDLRMNSSLVESEICAKMIGNGCMPIEIESKYLSRKSGISKGSSFRVVFQAFTEMIKLVYVVQRFLRTRDNIYKN